MAAQCLVVLVLTSSYAAASVLKDFLNPLLLPRAGCSADNCYNAYTHSLAIASPFCSTYIRSTTLVTVTPTATLAGTVLTPATVTPTPIPPITTNSQLSSRCNLDTNSLGKTSTSLSLRLSSACTCISIVPITVTSTFFAPTFTTTVAAPTPTDCPSYDGSTYTAADGEVFDVYCNSGFASAYLPYTCESPVDSSDFTPCIECCSQHPDCIAAVAANEYGPSCVLATQYLDPERIPSRDDYRFNIAILRRPTDCASYDGSTYMSPGGAVFAVHCNTSVQGSMSVLLVVDQTLTYAACADTCSTTAGCAAFDYRFTKCRLFAGTRPLVSFSGLNVGVLQSPNSI